jgi:heme-degrading monooxygenase HmoA
MPSTTTAQPATAAEAHTPPITRPADTRTSVPHVTGVTEVTMPDRPSAARPAPSGRLPGMVLEVGEIEVRPGAEEEFAAAYRSVRAVLAGTPGCRSVRMTRGVESPSRFVLLVEWESVAAHEENFRGTDRFATWRGALGPFFARPPRVEHFADLD